MGRNRKQTYDIFQTVNESAKQNKVRGGDIG
jgi:hypothetical protein